MDVLRMTRPPEPQNMTVLQLQGLDPKLYANEVRIRLRRDEYWLILTTPELIGRTRHTLSKIIGSIDAQRNRAAEAGTTTPEWLRGINMLQSWCEERMEALPVAPSSTREARAWRAFSARLAEYLSQVAPEALDGLQAPFSGLTAREWLDARQAKERNPQ